MPAENKDERQQILDLERTAKRLEEEIDAYNARLERECHARWRAAAGDRYDEMLRSRAAAENYALDQDQDPNVRCVALQVLMYHWGVDQKFATICETVAIGDPNQEVREMGLIGLVHYYSNSGNRRIGALLAAMVKDESQPTRTRQIAYDGLCRIRGVASPFWAIKRGTFRFPEDVDWALIREFL